VKAVKDEEFIEELSDIPSRRILVYGMMMMIMRHVDPLLGNDRETNN
jgi:hypothetical protein